MNRRRAAWIAASVLLAATVCCSPRVPQGRFTRWVDPFIGTGGHGHTYPGAVRPFGMVQLSPDTRLEGWDGSSGYHDADRIVYGFSHTHLSGTGIPDYCDILFMPGTGAVEVENGADGGPGYRSAFRKETERASPGYYRVHLDDPDVEVELTATTRAGMHRYTFGGDGSGHVVVDLSHRDRVLASSLQILSDTEVAGLRRSSSWARDQYIYFYARFSRPFTGYGIAAGDSLMEGARSRDGRDLKAWFTFEADPNHELLVKVGLSAVDARGARANLDAEIPDWDFDAVRREADLAWDAELGRIEVHGGTPEQYTTFYTALYHTMLAPNVFSDADGHYRGLDGSIHAGGTDVQYTVFSLWDTFRAAHPLYTLMQQRRSADFIRTFLKQYREGGLLPVWELAGNETGTMIGYHAVPVILDAWAKGIHGYDGDEALEAMKKSASQDARGLAAYREHGYIPSDAASESVSRTLEYAYDDWCIAEMARLLGDEETQVEYLERAQYYKNLFDPASRFMRPKRNGGWVAPFDPRAVTFDYTEANAWQYSFFAPQDVPGLIALMGGPEAFEAKLDSLFEAPSETTGRQQADITGLIGQYAHGNEPSHHMAYLYAWTPAPWKTQERVRQIMDTLYRAAPDGLAGNEDCGQMSAWYVLSALGFYPVTPGLPAYTLGTPLFEEAILHLENGRTFTIRADRPSTTRRYVEAVSLSRRPHPSRWISHEDILAGGTLRFWMGEDPVSDAFGFQGAVPPSGIVDTSFQPVPFVAAGERVFEGRTRVRLDTPVPGARIRYTLDDRDPRESGRAYQEPFTLTRETRLRFASEGPDGVWSKVVEARFTPMPRGRSIRLATAYAPQYAAGGDRALIDGLRGGPDFRTGSWQGYEGTGLDAVVDLGVSLPVEAVTVGFLQDVDSWIWMPVRVSVSVSEDGATWQRAGSARPQAGEHEEGAVTEDLTVPVRGRTARYIRVQAVNRGTCPPWHKGAGGKAWIFADEIVIRLSD